MHEALEFHGHHPLPKPRYVIDDDVEDEEDL